MENKQKSNIIFIGNFNQDAVQIMKMYVNYMKYISIGFKNSHTSTFTKTFCTIKYANKNLTAYKYFKEYLIEIELQKIMIQEFAKYYNNQISISMFELYNKLVSLYASIVCYYDQILGNLGYERDFNYNVVGQKTNNELKEVYDLYNEICDQINEKISQKKDNSKSGHQYKLK